MSASAPTFASLRGALLLAREETRERLRAAPAPYYCRCCGEECEDRRDCCSDDFPEPGDIRETGR